MNKNHKNFLFALDVGSKKLTLAAGEMNKNGHLSNLLIETQPSRGIFKGVVNDLAALSDAVQKLFKKMQERCHVKASQVALSINGNYINARQSIAAIALSERGMRSITRRDIERLNLQARTLGLELDENLLHEYPQGYSIDKHNMTLNPLGLHGRKFEVDLLLICANTGYVENITKAVEQAGFDVMKVVFSGVSASEAVLSLEEKEKGAILIDMGDALTSVLIFKDGVVRKVNVLSFGGKNLAEIIANYCKIPLDLADEIKETSIEIGHDVLETEEVMIKTEYAYRPIKKKELIAITLPEIDKFIGMLKSLVFESGVAGTTGIQIVATGGLSLLEGLLEKMEQELGLPVKMGTPRGITDIPVSKAPAYASAIGLLNLQRDAYQKTGLKFQAQGKNKITRIVDYITTLYQDYF